jgi:GNAT superfamily N-acetyltransferase
MRHRELLPAGAPPVSMRAARFEDVSGILRLVEGAIEQGCREHYGERQRQAVFAGYASTLFVDALGPFESLVAEVGGRLAGYAQVDLAGGGLRALFVDASFHGQGVGRALLAAIEARARAAGCRRLGGAMSLNAVSFYAAAGFRPLGAPERLRTAQVWVPILRMEKWLGE